MPLKRAIVTIIFTNLYNLEDLHSPNWFRRAARDGSTSIWFCGDRQYYAYVITVNVKNMSTVKALWSAAIRSSLISQKRKPTNLVDFMKRRIALHSIPTKPNLWVSLSFKHKPTITLLLPCRFWNTTVPQSLRWPARVASELQPTDV